MHVTNCLTINPVRTLNLFIRISDTDLCFATWVGGSEAVFNFEPYQVRPQASLTVNLREAMNRLALLNQSFDRVEVLVDTPVTAVPLDEFQEEDAECIYNYCFVTGERRRIFYDTVPALNMVLLFALNQATCRTIEEAFGTVRYTSVYGPVLQHFAGKRVGNSECRRLFVYLHNGIAIVSVMDAERLLLLNTYNVHTLSDMCYYTFSLASQAGLDLSTTPLFVAGDAPMRDSLVDEFDKYAAKVYVVNPAAEFNRHIVSITPQVPFDLMCALIK